MAIKDISFFSGDIDFVLKQKTAIRKWINESIHEEGFRRISELNFIFCSDDYLLQINSQYLQHETFTDIITFDNSEDEDVIMGDVFISVDRVRENAERYGVEFQHEMCRVIIHGVMHLCGYLDKKVEDKKLMTEKEDFYLNRI